MDEKEKDVNGKDAEAVEQSERNPAWAERFSQMIACARQLLYPREFRISIIPEPKIPPVPVDPPVEPDEPIAGDLKPPAFSPSSKFVADLATHLWRMRRMILDPDSGTPREEMERVSRPFESAWDAFIEEKIEILDHTDAVFYSGMALNVLAFEPTPGLERETIKETLRPTVRFGNELIQQGEVIVGTPEVRQ